MQFGCNNMKQEHRQHYTYIQPSLATSPALRPAASSPPRWNNGSTLEFYLIVEFTFFSLPLFFMAGMHVPFNIEFYFLLTGLPVCANKLNGVSCPWYEVQTNAEVFSALAAQTVACCRVPATPVIVHHHA